MQDEPVMTDAPATPQPDRPLVDEIKDALSGHDCYDSEEGQTNAANAIMQLLMKRGHYLPGAPPAQKILEDAKVFAERLTLSNLTVRILLMLDAAAVINRETDATKRWITDYVDGINHGPLGQAMLWPKMLPGMVRMLREWGYAPTPSTPPYVYKIPANPRLQ